MLGTPEALAWCCLRCYLLRCLCHLFAQIKRHPQRGAGRDSLQTSSAAHQILLKPPNRDPPRRQRKSRAHHCTQLWVSSLRPLNVPNRANVQFLSPYFDTQRPFEHQVLLVGLGHPHGTSSRSIPVPLHPCQLTPCPLCGRSTIPLPSCPVSKSKARDWTNSMTSDHSPAGVKRPLR